MKAIHIGKGDGVLGEGANELILAVDARECFLDGLRARARGDGVRGDGEEWWNGRKAFV